MALYLGNSARKIILGGLRYKLNIGTNKAVDDHEHTFVNAYTCAEDYSWCRAVGTCSVCQKTIEETTTNVDILAEEATCISCATYDVHAIFNNPLFNGEYGYAVVTSYEDTAGGYDATNHTNATIHYTTETTHSIYCPDCGLDHRQDGSGNWIGSEVHTPSRDLWNSDFDYHWPTCRVCEYKMVNQKEAHSFGDWTITDDGKRQKTCTVCGLVLQDNCQHNWTTSINWNDDYSICYASADCSKCGIHVETQSNYVVRIEDTPANCVSAAIMHSWVSSWVKDVGPFVGGGIDLNNDGMFDAVYSDTYEDPEAKLGPHTWNDLNGEGTDPGLGYKVKYCTVCEESVPLDHDPDICGKFGFEEVTVERIEPTCTDNGYITTKCSYCEELIKDFEVIPALGHNYNNGICSNCGATQQYPGGGESDCKHEETSEMTRVDPTCGAAGYIVYQCDICGYEFEEPIPATGQHTGGTATCTEQAKCTVCGQNYGNKAEHNTETLKAVPATCSATGLTEGKKCSVCDTIIVAQETIEVDPTAHNAGDTWYTGTGDELQHWQKCSLCDAKCNEGTCTPEGEQTIYEQATCEHGSYWTRQCSVCGGLGEYGENTDKLDHKPYNEPEVPATCESIGLTAYSYCSECKTVLGDPPKPIPALGHDYDDTSPTCVRCGQCRHNTGGNYEDEDGNYRCSYCHEIIEV